MPAKALSFSELRNLSDDQLVKMYDYQARTTRVGIDYFVDELNRRYQERSTKAMLEYTK